MKLNQSGLAPILILLASLGLIIFVLVSSSFTFKDKLFSLLYPKPPSHAASSTDTSYNMSVLIIKYFPLTTDGQNIDISITGDVGDSYSTIKQRTIDVTTNLKIAIEKATRYLGYKDNNASSSLNYQIVDTKEYTQAVPLVTDGTRRPNYNQIMTYHNICDYVENKAVLEVWIWAYQGPTFPGSTYPYLNISESKMSGPYGDISNSGRYNDMPVCQKTYRVYTFNFGRFTAEALESWGHQIEVELDTLDQYLFRTLFQGPSYPPALNVNGRCGSVHNPPNATKEYDRNNPNPQKSDCLDWNPDGLGNLSDISCQNWGCTDLNYMIWNWQNLPGRLNNKTYQGKNLRNFWDVHGDFDKVMGSDRSLTFIVPTPTPGLTSSPSPSPTATPTPTPTPSPSHTPSPSPSHSPTPSPVPVPRVTATARPTPNTPVPKLLYTSPYTDYTEELTNIFNNPGQLTDLAGQKQAKDKNCGILCNISRLITDINRALEQGVETILKKFGLLPAQTEELPSL